MVQGVPYHACMRMLSLDYDPAYGDDTLRSRFGGDISAFDYDLVIWDPAASFDSYHSNEWYRGRRLLSEHVSVQMRSDAARRRAEFVEYISSGRVLIVTVRPPQECYVDTGQRSYSGTGHNRVTTKQVESFDLLSALPTSNCIFTGARGSRIEFDGDGPIVELLRKYRKHLAYEAVVTNPPGTVLAHVTGTDRVLASIRRSKAGGHLILLPAIRLAIEYDPDNPEYFDREDAWLPEAREFQVDLLSAVERLSGVKSVSRPPWADQYATDEQQHLRSEIVKQQERIEAARNGLRKLQQAKDAAEARDQLYLGTGRALELEVKGVLELLGGTVTEPDPGRDDWKVMFPEGEAVVEVKGVTKSAAEKHAAQLEKWVAGAMEETDKKPKAILVVNTWRNLPLSERVEADFPDQMLPYCQSREHCLITGLQLFVLRSDVEKIPDRAEYWRNRLLEASGMITGCEDWQSVIRETRS
jgi:hypothetical protein